MQPTCFAASDSCCSILSTTFLKGGLLKGSASQQDRIIWYLHSSIRTHKHFYLSTVITSPSFLHVYCFLFSLPPKRFNMSVLVMLEKSQMQQDESGLLFKPPTLHSFIVSPPPSIQSHHLSCDLFYALFFFSHFTSTPFTHTHISFQRQLTFHWVQTLEHPFCILLLSVCRTWRPQAYQDMDCFLHSAGRFSYIMHLGKHTDSQTNIHNCWIDIPSEKISQSKMP